MAQQIQQPSAQETSQQYSQIPGQQSQFGQQPQAQVGQQLPSQFGLQQPGQQQPSQQLGQQTSQRARQAISPSVQQYEKTMPSEFRVALHDVNTLAEVADWCRDQCLDKGPQVANVTRTLEDLRDVAELNERFITHDSAYGPHVAEALLRIAEQSIPELQQHQQDPAVADTIPVVERAVESTEKLLRSVSWQPQTGHQVGQQQVQRFGREPTQRTGQQVPAQQPTQLTTEQSQYGRPQQVSQ